MAEDKRPDETGQTGQGKTGGEADFERRRRELDSRLSALRPAGKVEADGPRSRDMAGMGKALRLSSEFIAGIVVGAVIGWFVDQVAGTSPWGLIVFLLLGFVAGVLNVMRSAGVVAEHPVRTPDGDRN
ncbi:AtpZ/AtpI family protein [Aliihoeflea sp. PC F10.4]